MENQMFNRTFLSIFVITACQFLAFASPSFGEEIHISGELKVFDLNDELRQAFSDSQKYQQQARVDYKVCNLVESQGASCTWMKTFVGQSNASAGNLDAACSDAKFLGVDAIFVHTHFVLKREPVSIIRCK
jgi:hypothetical protein